MTEMTSEAIANAVAAGIKSIADAQAPVVTELLDSRSFRIFETEGFAEVELKANKRDTDSSLICSVRDALSSVIGHYQANRYNFKYPLSLLVKNYSALADCILCRESEDTSEPVFEGEYEKLFSFIKERVEAERERVAKAIASGRVEFGDLGVYFAKDEIVFCEIDGETIAGRVLKHKYEQSFYGSYLELQTEVLHNLGGFVQKGIFTMYVPEYRGFTSIGELLVRKLNTRPDLIERLKERGELYRKFVDNATYCSYSGNLVKKSWYGSSAVRADGRVMLDAATMRQIASDTIDQLARRSGIRYDDEYDRRKSAGVKKTALISDDDLVLTWPYLYGFSFRAKMWGEMAVNGLSEINWREDAFDKLVLDPDEKKVVRALVEHSGTSFSDIVEGKGGGCIFMLHGEPGQGKTLTAETVAEYLKRPLYSVSVGELGTDPDELEERLRNILDVATIWNAVLLLDESDIFLEARDERDVLRNAMVGVFLRLLEYHQGVLFLTTNRVKNIDRAFYSRISIAIGFGAADSEKRAKIWLNLLDAAKVLSSLEEGAVEKLAEYDLNGRQIKNIIRNSQTLAKADGVPTVSLDRLIKMIELTTAFERNMSGADATLSATVGGVVRKLENFRVPGLHR